MAAMLIRRSLRGELLRRAGPTLLSASKQTEAAAFLSSSSAAGAAARIRTKVCSYPARIAFASNSDLRCYVSLDVHHVHGCLL